MFAAGASNDCALVVVPRAFSHMVITFRGRRKGNLVLWCSTLTHSPLSLSLTLPLSLILTLTLTHTHSPTFSHSLPLTLTHTFRDRCKGSEVLYFEMQARARCSTLDIVVIIEEPQIS